MSELRISLLLHFHQPHYVDEATGEALLPWVRLHAVKGYYDVPWVLERRPALRVTLNLTPVLLLQLERYASGRTTDLFERVSRIPPADLSEAERRFVVQNFFSIQPARIREVPRYWELYQRRAPHHEDAGQAAAAFGAEELGDLQCLFNLAWMGFGSRTDEPLLADLLQRGRGFTQEERVELLDLQRRVAGRALQKIRALAATGQVEVSTSPLYHPILPLVHDTAVARRVSPASEPPPSFSRPDDVRFQLDRAAELVERSMGVRPVGLWPSEGSVSPEILPAVKAAGFQWLATDELILLKSLPPGAHPRAALYKPYRVGGLAVVFRDRPLADRISFHYQHWEPGAAVEDFVGRTRAIARLTRGAPAVVTVACDGENPWESYPDGGRGFLEGLGAALEGDPAMGYATVGEAVANVQAEPLARFGSGSWIRGTFDIWAGKPQKNAAWATLARTRELAGDLDGTDPWGDEERARAFRSLMAAEGSDWFWWYDEDFFSLHRDLFDYLFRRHQQNALALSQRVREPGGSASSSGASALGYLRRTLRTPIEEGPGHEPPRTLVAPVIDGAVGGPYEWSGAGRYRAPSVDPLLRTRSSFVEELHYGFDESTLYLRYDYGPGAAEAAGVEALWRVDFGDERRLVHAFRGAGGTLEIEGGAGEPGRLAQGDVCELAVSLAALGVGPARKGTLELELRRGGVTLQTVPPLSALGIAAPDPRTVPGMWVT